MSETPVPPARARRLAAFLTWMANLCFGLVLGANWLAHVPEVEGPKMWLFALPALVSTLLMLTLLPGLAFYAWAHFARSTRALSLVQGLFWNVFQVLLFADTRIYNVFRYHFNGQVLNLLYTRGSEDAIHLGWQVWLAVSAGLVFGVWFQTLVWRRALRYATRAVEEDRHLRFLRPGVVWGVVLLPAVFVEKTIYAQADLARDRQVTALARIFPLYARLPMEDLASKVLNVEADRPPRVEIEGFELDYPHALPTIEPLRDDDERPSFLVIVVDCLRYDMVTPETMPNVERWSADARHFQDHLSGGNSTRYGIFSMMYGLHGSYWFSFLQEKRSPVLIDALDGAGYELAVFSSASMNYPELRETAWAGIPAHVHDAFPGREPWERDVQAGEALREWLGERARDQRPYFGFILLDSPHQTYSHPPETTPFLPESEAVDYMLMTRNDGPEPHELERVYNRYRNAVWHADEVTGEILDTLASLELDDDTIVIVTGDHGEEFRECGFFGHTSAYTREQVTVPFLMRGPGIEPGVESRPTSHLDFAPTVLELLGADPTVRAEWTLGENLFDPPAERSRVVAGWNELGVWTSNGIVRVPLSLLEFDVELYDYRWNLIVDDRDALAEESETLMELGAQCNRFLVKGSRWL